ncbi:transmembrane sensor [Xanthomonas sacchari]|uniref:FecR family protein n=1 Tax=Xanthomonas sacchari TaxID=56458 RepID=UPI0027887FE2|nr:FecR domain-containing protein [Xanthomonas sacchari]MDQ1092149.1 transmembrane sensor [Xanthomonas sacchari]
MPAPPHVDDALFEQALHWLLQLDAAPDDPDTRRAHAAWLALAPQAHAQAMAEAGAMLGLLQAPAAALADELDPVAAAVAAPLPTSSPTHTRRHRRWPRHAAAAAGLALAIGGGLWLGSGGVERLRSDAYTRVGEIRTLRLADGSVVTLDTDSAIAVELRPGLRTVRLLRGEAAFQVTHDPRRPFVVDSRGGSARVLGTRFAVRVQGDTAEVGVIAGRVAVRAPDGGAGAVLGAGQSARLQDTVVRRLADRDPLTIGAWQRRQLVFSDMSLAQALDALARYRHGHVVVRGDALRALPVSGSLDIADPDLAMRTLLDSLRLRSLDLPWLTIVYRSPADAAGVTAPKK